MKKTKLAIIKYKVLELRSNRQIPYFLAKLINDLTGKEETKYVQYLLEMTEHMLRVKGYYKKFPIAEKDAEKFIKDGLFKLGY